MKRFRFFFAPALALVLVLGGLAAFAPMFEPELGWAYKSGRSFGSSGSGYGKSSSWSSSTYKTWNRNGGGYFGSSGKESGYTKPPVGKVPDTSGYSKPGLKEAPPTTAPKTLPAPDSGVSGYSKPALRDTSPTTLPKTGPPPDSGAGGYSKPALKDQSLPAGPATTQERPVTSGGYAKPGVQAAPKDDALKAGDQRTSGGYAKPGVGAKPGAFSGGSKFDKETLAQERKKRSQESLLSYQAENAKFKKPEQKADPSTYESNPLYQKGKVYSDFDYGTHYSQRDNYYRAGGYRPPAQAYNTGPSFGIFDTLFLFWMLDHASNRNAAAMAYHHSNDPGYQKWRQEVEQMSGNNSELKAKIAELDRQVKALEGTPKDGAYLPKGVPPEVALSAAALAAKKPEKPLLRFATGQVGGVYDKYGAMFKKNAEKLDVQLINSAGSADNLKLIADGKADMALVQSDALALMDKLQPGKDVIAEQAELYDEYVQMVANRDGSVKSLADLNPKTNVLYVGPKGSGTALTWEALCELEHKYKAVPVKTADYAAALLEVRRNPKAVMMFVGGLNSDFLKKAEEEAKRSGKLRLVTVFDKRFGDRKDKHGNSIYKFVKIPADIYPSLQKGWLFGEDVETLAVTAVLALRTDWAEKFGPTAMDYVSSDVLLTKPEIQKLVNGTSPAKAAIQRAPSVAKEDAPLRVTERVVD